MAGEPKRSRATPDDSAVSASVMRQQLDDANERIRRGQRRARYLMDELSKEVARNRELAAEIDWLRAKVAEPSKS
jgi:hypothetical protein